MGRVKLPPAPVRGALAEAVHLARAFLVTVSGRDPTSLGTSTPNLAGGLRSVDFGVFALYEDRALDDALDVALRLAMSAPLADVLSYPKLAKAYFAFFEIVFRNHLAHALAHCEGGVFLAILRALHDGVAHADAALSAQCAAAIDHLASFYFAVGAREQSRRQPPRAADAHALAALRAHLGREPDVLRALIATLFGQLLYGPPSSHWAVTRPVLPLVLADRAAFDAYREQLLASQPPEQRQRLAECFAKLLGDVQPHLEPNNRDRFTQRLSAFRIEARSFITT